MSSESTHKGVNHLSKVVTQAQQQRPESSTVTPTWQAEDVPLVEFMYLVFTRRPGESYSRRLRFLYGVLV